MSGANDKLDAMMGNLTPEEYEDVMGRVDALGEGWGPWSQEGYAEWREATVKAVEEGLAALVLGINEAVGPMGIMIEEVDVHWGDSDIVKALRKKGGKCG